MDKIFFIGDTHFFHEKIIIFEPNLRPFKTIQEHNEELIKRWNSVIRPDDMVYHLGDVCFGNIENLDILHFLHGRKQLIMGNHDRYPTETYLKYFEKLHGILPFKGGVLSHSPLHSDSIQHRWKFNIHGHFHSKNVVMNPHEHESLQIKDPRYINVSCEQINLTPIELSQLNLPTYEN